MESTLAYIQGELEKLENEMLAETAKREQVFSSLHPTNITAAKNLINYLVFCQKDRSRLQLALHTHGLSALSNAESHILFQIQSVRQRLGHAYNAEELSTCTYATTKENLNRRANLLFSGKEGGNGPYLMVTLDAEIAQDNQKVRDLIDQGMNIARINCAHDDQAAWKEIIATIRRLEQETGKTCKIYMDLAGPKIRTRFLGSQAGKKKINIDEGGMLYLSASRDGFDTEDIVISPNELAILDYLKPGQRVFIDDGKIFGMVESADSRGVGVRIRKIFSKKHVIKADKGLNFPDSKIKIQSLTPYDRKVLPFVVKHADLVGYSFVNTVSDIRDLREEMRKHVQDPPSIILKIETMLSVKNLSALLLEGMREELMGVMIARGDLAVEMGFQKMAEIQDDILWLCEAAHVPVIWATQVLENLHKTGIATRSEITDASQAALAECIMINKGPHTLDVIQYLKEIIERTSMHRIKKRFVFQKLRATHELFLADE